MVFYICVKKHALASEQDTPRVQQLRHDYRRWLDKIDIRNLVFVDKLCGGLQQRDESRVLTATLELLHEMTRAVAIARGALIDSANTYFAQVMHNVGIDST